MLLANKGLCEKGVKMKEQLLLNKEWEYLREYLTVYGDFVLKDPKITDQVIRETEEELKRGKTQENKEMHIDLAKKIFDEKLENRILYDDSDEIDENEEIVYDDPAKDDIIKEVISKMVSDIRKRRNYERD